MTLKDLRERTKRAYHEARQVPQGIGKSRFQGLNMRQAWEENKKMVLAFSSLEWPVGIVIPSALVTFHHDGELYYHAKKHGLKSAMLLRLKRI